MKIYIMSSSEIQGYRTLNEAPPGSYDVCPICFWEEDGIQFDDPDLVGAANRVSLREGQKNFLEFGACERDMISYVRKPNQSDIKDNKFVEFN